MLLIALLFPQSSSAEEICFDEGTAGKIVVDLERAKIAEQQLVVAAEGSEELKQQLTILKGTIQLLQDQIEVYKQIDEVSKNMIEMKNQISVAKDQIWKQQVDAAKPSFFDNAKIFLGGIGVGALVILLVL